MKLREGNPYQNTLTLAGPRCLVSTSGTFYLRNGKFNQIKILTVDTYGSEGLSKNILFIQLFYCLHNHHDNSRCFFILFPLSKTSHEIFNFKANSSNLIQKHKFHREEVPEIWGGTGGSIGT